MFIVNRCVRDYEDVWKTVIAEFDSLSAANAFAAHENDYNPFNDVWFEVSEDD